MRGRVRTLADRAEGDITRLRVRERGNVRVRCRLRRVAGSHEGTLLRVMERGTVRVRGRVRRVAGSDEGDDIT